MCQLVLILGAGPISESVHSHPLPWSLPGLPALADLHLKRKHGAPGTGSPHKVGGGVHCAHLGVVPPSLSAPHVHTDAASSNSEIQTRCFVGGASQSMSPSCRLRAAPFTSVCSFCLALWFQTFLLLTLLLFLLNLLSIYTLHLSHYTSTNGAKLPFPKLKSW